VARYEIGRKTLVKYPVSFFDGKFLGLEKNSCYYTVGSATCEGTLLEHLNNRPGQDSPFIFQSFVGFAVVLLTRRPQLSSCHCQRRLSKASQLWTVYKTLRCLLIFMSVNPPWLELCRCNYSLWRTFTHRSAQRASGENTFAKEICTVTHLESWCVIMRRWSRTWRCRDCGSLM